MAVDNTEAFAAEVAPRRTREELEAELAALEQETDQELAPVEDKSGDEEEWTRPIATVHCNFLGRDIGIIVPTDVDLMLFQSDMGSKVLNDVQKVSRQGDFCREHVDVDDYDAWERAVRDRSARDPKRAFVIFYEALNELVQLIADQSESTDEKEMTAAVNRAERRAALREMKRKAKKD